MFDLLHASFEKKDTNLYELEQEEGFSKYILIRSFDTESLKLAILRTTREEAVSSKQDDLYKELFNTSITIDELISIINEIYPSIKAKRMEEEKHLPAVIKDFGVVKCGIRNDNMNDVAKALVRDKSIQTKEELDTKVDDLLEGTIRGYILWQYYNQVTNDLIEHIINDHDTVIPTLRKIHDVDFFIKLDNKIIPFDLKITHISNDFYDMYSKGVVPIANKTDEHKCSTSDDYCISTEGLSELAQIKDLYKKIKTSHDLPNVGKQKKADFLNNLKSLGNNDIDEMALAISELNDLKAYYKQIKADYALPNMSDLTRDEMISYSLLHNKELTNLLIDKLLLSRASCTNSLKNNRKVLEWWNYKFQGERLFKNNNRFFVFLAYSNSFEDARPLKGNVEDLRDIINSKLNSISSKSDLNVINYFYDKDRNRRGSYKILSSSVIYIK